MRHKREFILVTDCRYGGAKESCQISDILAKKRIYISFGNPQQFFKFKSSPTKISACSFVIPNFSPHYEKIIKYKWKGICIFLRMRWNAHYKTCAHTSNATTLRRHRYELQSTPDALRTFTIPPCIFHILYIY